MPRPSILNATLGTDSSGDCYTRPYTETAGTTNDNFDGRVLVLEDGSTNGFHGFFTVPDDYSSGGTIYVYWTANTNTGNAVFDIQTEFATDAEDMDGSSVTTQPSTATAQAAPGTAHYRQSDTISLTDTIAASDTMEFYFRRQGGHASDTMATDMIVFDVLFDYTAS
jgi:hypothetical protein